MGGVLGLAVLPRSPFPDAGHRLGADRGGRGGLAAEFERRLVHDRHCDRDLFFLCASGFGAIYLVYIQKHQLAPMQGAAMVSVFSGLVVVPWFFASPIKSRILETPGPELLLRIFYQCVGAGALFVALLSYIVVRLGRQRFSMIVACVPILALLFGRRIAAGDGISL
jgi:hypothetical protein